MEKRYILAFVLIALVIVLQMVLLRPKPSELEPIEQTSQQSETTGQQTTVQSVEETDPGSLQTEELQSNQNQNRWMVSVKTNKYDIIFDQNAVARQWKLVEYFERWSENETADPSPVNLIPEAAKNCLNIELAPNSEKSIVKQSNALNLVNWELVNNLALKLTEDGTDIFSLDLRQNPFGKNTLTFRKRFKEKMEIRKTFTFYADEYYIDLEVSFRNISPDLVPIQIGDGKYGYSLRWGPGIFGDRIPHDQPPKEKNESAIALRPGEPSKVVFMKKKDLGDIDNKTDGSKAIEEQVLWVGLNNRYFSAILIPETSRGAHAKLIELDELNLPAWPDRKSSSQQRVVASTQAACLLLPETDLTDENFDRFRIYVGPKITSILAKIEAPDSSAAKVEKVYLNAMLSFGFMAPIAHILLKVLNLCNKLVNNYGISIILLTLLVKGLTAPLTLKAYRASQDMKKIQPQLTALKEKYRDNPQRFNQEQMALFKRHKISPLGGCLPMLPSLPIFFALFDLLRNAIELRGAGLWWINDLTAPDAIYTLPFSIPILGENVNLLPLLYAGTTLLQQKIGGGMETATADNPHMKMMQYMPLIFTFIFYNFASGLVLYFLCSNIFTIGQNLITKRIFEQDVETVASAENRD
ncbi:MAG: YidC/Oxa1 family insertase periplasmic-domain containing protein [Candidatus Poribacteria bacterium]|jgi:YidC/Oxa1 family membrane protein insertase|nr:YidC/Oxa1 family insertase periplasmic-domain containing protein [Candidatus Poribacteria bacterium]MDP6745735.1 YidC/Oxa1 family insertase periplasmic-domain containing protein [Candidatus Poribacteria bacterium]MDP6996099.1 YidC/Oxa1 family insertase periplasmic-domain containing protein [Candidatus Poribacteria bacterium]